MQQGDLQGAGLVTPCGGAGGKREGSQGGAGRIAGRLCLVVRWQGIRVACYARPGRLRARFGLCLRSGFAREKESGAG